MELNKFKYSMMEQLWYSKIPFNVAIDMRQSARSEQEVENLEKE